MQVRRRRRRVSPRPRPPALAPSRADACRRLPVGLERRRHGDAGRRDRRARARGRRARVGRRGALRPARADRRAGGRRRRPALLAVQVLRPAPRARLRPARAARVVAAVQGAPVARTCRSGTASRRARTPHELLAGFVAAVELPRQWVGWDFVLEHERVLGAAVPRRAAGRMAPAWDPDDGRPRVDVRDHARRAHARARGDRARRAGLRGLARQLLRGRDHEAARPAGRRRACRHRPLQHGRRGRRLLDALAELAAR